uniref:KRAB domain-containing protein n=1 Tax=Marmota marmota marmota TaxID=9994 RepID=A0A8C6EYE1_MARMA
RAAAAVRDCAATCVLFKESVTFEDVAVGLSQEWALLDDVRRDLCRYVLLDNYQTLACRGEAGIAPFLAAYVCRILPQCLPCGRACGLGLWGLLSTGVPRSTKPHLLH